jgi:hypothetical protein
MEATTIGLIASGVAATSAITVAIVSHRLQIRREHRLWLRNRKEEAYQNSTRYICKLLVKISSSSLDEMVLDSMSLGSDKPSEEVVEAYIWTMSLVIACSKKHKSKIKKVSAILLEFAAWKKADMHLNTISDLYSTVLEYALQDLKK